MTQSTQAKYFDLHTTGVGYLNRIREVPVRKGPAFLACTVAALHGDADDVEYSYIDCKVAGAEAQNLVRRCMEAESLGKKIIINFRIGDIRAEVFTYSSGEKKGQSAAQLKGRLLYISRISVDGEEVYKAPVKDSAALPSDSDQDQASTAEQAA